jgi:putative spermidine/putrescine transport system permease protein
MSDRMKIVLLLAPALAVIGLLFFGGLAVGVLRSLGYMSVSGLSEPGLGAYRAVLSDPRFFRSFLLTLHIALTSTVLSAVIALCSALLLRRTFAGRRLVGFLFQLNLTIPHLVGAIGILYLFSQSGSFARLAFQANLIAGPRDFPALVYDPWAVGIILQYVWKEVPFIGVVLLASMQTAESDHEAVARTLGATRWQAFRHVLLPQIRPGLLAASVIVFAFTFGAYEIPALLGPSHPPTLPVLAYRSYTGVDLAGRPQALAMGVIIAVLSCALTVIFRNVLLREIRR